MAQNLAVENLGPRISAGTVMASTGTVVFSNAGSVTFGMSGSTITASVGAPAGGSGPSIGATVGGPISDSTAVFSNSNNVSFGMSDSSVLTAAVPYCAGIGVSTGGNTSGNTMTVSKSTYVFEGSVFITLSQITGTDGIVTVKYSGRAPGVSALSAGTTNFTSGQIVFSDSNNISFGYSATAGNTASFTASFSALSQIGVSDSGNTAGSTKISSGTAVFVGTNGVTLSQATAAGQHTVQVSYAGNGSDAISAGTQTVNSGTLIFSNSNGWTWGMSGSSRITASASAGAAGQSISYFQRPNAWWDASRTEEATLMVQPFFFPANMSATRMNLMGRITSGAGAGSLSISVVVYTMTGSTANSASSGSGSVNNTVTGTRWISVPGLGTWNFTPGEYYLGVLVGTPANGGTITFMGQSSISMAGGYSNTFNVVDFWGPGLYSANTGAIPASLHISDIVRTGTAGAQPGFVLLGTF